MSEENYLKCNLSAGVLQTDKVKKYQKLMVNIIHSEIMGNIACDLPSETMINIVQ